MTYFHLLSLMARFSLLSLAMGASSPTQVISTQAISTNDPTYRDPALELPPIRDELFLLQSTLDEVERMNSDRFVPYQAGFSFDTEPDPPVVPKHLF